MPSEAHDGHFTQKLTKVDECEDLICSLDDVVPLALEVWIDIGAVVARCEQDRVDDNTDCDEVVKKRIDNNLRQEPP